jgi:CDP-diglyceride synthetase
VSTPRSGVLARTVCGALLALAAGVALLGAALFADGRFVLGAGAALSFALVAEVSLRGRLTTHNLPVVLTIPLLAVVFLEHAALGARALEPAAVPRGGPIGGGGLLALEYGLALGVAGLVYTLSRGLTQAVGQQSNLRRVFLLVLGAGLVSGLAYALERGAEPRTIVLVVLAVAAVGATTVVFERESRRGLLIAMGLAGWLAVPLVAMTQLWESFGTAGLVACIVMSKGGDVAGYYVGRSIGRSHPFPRISPKKTTAGCVASLVAGAALGLAAAALGLLPPGPLGLASGLAAGVVINLAAQAGDLLESLVKRRAGVKDSSSWLGPSGGPLDVVDSLLLTVPAAIVSWPFLFGG